HTRSDRDWSSDVCSSDLTARFPAGVDDQAVERALIDAGFRPDQLMAFEGKEGAVQLDLQGVRHGGWVEFRRGVERLFTDETAIRSEERRVGKEGRAGGWR